MKRASFGLKTVTKPSDRRRAIIGNHTQPGKFVLIDVCGTPCTIVVVSVCVTCVQPMTP